MEVVRISAHTRTNMYRSYHIIYDNTIILDSYIRNYSLFATLDFPMQFGHNN